MNTLQKIRTRFGHWLIKQAQELTILPPWARHTVFAFGYLTLVNEGYKKNVAVSAAVRVLSRSFLKAPLEQWAEGDSGILEVIENSPIRTLLETNTALMGESEFLALCMQYRSIGGNVYIWKQRSDGRKVVGLWPFSDAAINVVPSTTTEGGMVSHYELDIGGGNAVTIPTEDIIHWKWEADPAQPWIGIGPIALAALAVNTLNEANEYIFSLLANDATPPLIINLKEGQPFDEELSRRLKAQWAQKYGRNNRGLPAFLEHGMDAKQLSFTMDEMAFNAIQNHSEFDILASFDVPPEMTSLEVGRENSTYNNVATARTIFFEDIMTAHWSDFASEMMQGLANEIGFVDIVLAFDTTNVDALQENLLEKHKRNLEAYLGNGITRNEYRRSVGLPDLIGSDVFKGTALEVFTPAGAEIKGVPLDYLDRLILSGVTSRGYPMGTLKDGFPPPEQAPGANLSRKATPAQIRRSQPIVDGMRSIKGASVSSFALSVQNIFDRLGAETNQAIIEFASELQVSSITFDDELKFKTHHKALTKDEFRQLQLLLFGQIDATTASMLTEFETQYITVAFGTHNLLNLAFNVDIDFDRTQPAITEALRLAGDQIRAINDTTKDAVRRTLQIANDEGWSIEEIARGKGGIDGGDDIPGINQSVSQTYKGRGEAIARTELGTAQNNVTNSRYAQAGVKKVIVFDGGGDNSDDICNNLNHTIQTLGWMAANPLQHPNCVRAFGAVFED